MWIQNRNRTLDSDSATYESESDSDSNLHDSDSKFDSTTHESESGIKSGFGFRFVLWFPLRIRNRPRSVIQAWKLEWLWSSDHIGGTVLARMFRNGRRLAKPVKRLKCTSILNRCSNDYLLQANALVTFTLISSVRSIRHAKERTFCLLSLTDGLGGRMPFQWQCTEMQLMPGHAQRYWYVAGLQCGAFQTLSLQTAEPSSFLSCGSKCVSWWVSRGIQPLVIFLNITGRFERMHRCLKKLAARSTSWKTKLVGRVTVGNAGVTRSCQPGDRDVSITAGHRSATRFARPVGCWAV